MLSIIRRRIGSQLPGINPSRPFTQVVPTSDLAATSPPPPSNTEQCLYYVPRNTRGNLPVYTDVRNAGGRHMVLVRNIEGNAGALAKDLLNSLFEKESYEASRLKVQISQSKHLVISGGRWKNDVIEWLRRKGF